MDAVLVTGAAGFIGSHVSEALLARGQRVVGYDNLWDAASRDRKRATLERVSLRPGFSFVHGDVRDHETLRETLSTHRPCTIVHLAALAGVRESLRDPEAYADANVRGLAALLAVAGSVQSFVFASSSSVYGDRDDPPFRETDATDRPASPYAATKKAGELLLHAFWRQTHVPVTCLRYFTVYGPRQRAGMAIESFVRKLEAGESVTLYGDGSSARDYTYVDDIVDGTLRALDRAEGYRIVNLGSGRPVPLELLARLVARSLGRDANIRWEPDQPGDVRLTCASVERAKDLLGWRPSVPVEEGIARFVTWRRSVPS